MTIKIIVTSAGSLVGTNIIDALDDRRQSIRLIGIDSDVNRSGLRHFDSVFQSPQTDERGAFTDFLVDVLDREQPQLVLAGRDHDLLPLSSVRQRGEHPAITAGASEMATIMQDKWLSYLFATERGLPFAASYMLKGEQTSENLAEFIEQVGFPVIRKPRLGFGSIGITAIVDQSQLDHRHGKSGFVLQEYIDPPPRLKSLSAEFQFGIPFWMSLPETTHYACQTIISPAGKLTETFCSINTMRMGRCEYSRRVSQEPLIELGRSYARAAADAGWIGPFNVQCKKLQSGEYLAIEMNGRLTGTTSARYRMGFDEIGLLCSQFAGSDGLLILGQDREIAPDVSKTMRDV